MNEELEQRCTVADRAAPCDYPPCFTGNTCHGGALWPADTTLPTATPGGHIDFVRPGEHEDGGASCAFCEGGLSACTRCDAFEGAWPDECPGERMTKKQSDAVYAGTLNFRAGAWREGECCAVRRPVHDQEAWLAEVAAAGNLL